MFSFAGGDGHNLFNDVLIATNPFADKDGVPSTSVSVPQRIASLVSAVDATSSAPTSSTSVASPSHPLRLSGNVTASSLRPVTTTKTTKQTEVSVVSSSAAKARNWQTECGLDNYSMALKRECIDEAMLSRLDDSALIQLGVDDVNERLNILSNIAEYLRADNKKSETQTDETSEALATLCTTLHSASVAIVDAVRLMTADNDDEK